MSEARLLIALMEHDLALARSAKSLDELPEKRAILQLRQRLQEIQEAYDKASAYVAEVERLLARANDEIATLQQRATAEEAKSLSGAVTNPKELQHLAKEIASLKRAKDRKETEALALMEKLEGGAAQVAKIESILAEGRAKEHSLVAAYQKRGGTLQREMAKSQAERDALAAKLKTVTRNEYERLREVKHGIAVGVLRGGVCSACRIELPAERVQAIEAGPEITTCPACRRILIAGRSDVS